LHIIRELCVQLARIDWIKTGWIKSSRYNCHSEKKENICENNLWDPCVVNINIAGSIGYGGVSISICIILSVANYSWVICDMLV